MSVFMAGNYIDFDQESIVEVIPKLNKTFLDIHNIYAERR